MTPLIISADDYAQSAGIDAGILALVAQDRLTAFSCLTLSPRWPLAAELISAEVRSKADIGLHLDFTQYAQPARQALPILIARSLCHSLSTKILHSSISKQLDHFEDALGTPPDYIDGHQHVHQLPQIRDTLLNIVTHRYAGKLPWLRISQPPGKTLKALILNMLGAHQLRQGAQTMGLRHSDRLLGVYGFDGKALDYRHKLTGWLNCARQGNSGVYALMCHPALAGVAADDAAEDPISGARLQEYQILASPEFLSILIEYGIQPVRGDALNTERSGL
jgi:predicted glycoside hydrolase/deacetylase ChbG (UPF0249 family)